jgi:hypothetical protein
MARCFCVHLRDNVATLIDDATPGPVDVIGGNQACVEAREGIALGHKIALCDIGAGDEIVKFAVSIGRARRDIRAGEWVHLHNVTSAFDERSSTLDVHSGAVMDTKYE